MKDQQNKPLLRKKPIFVLSLAIFILIISGGYFYYRYEKNAIRQDKYSALKIIADLKIRQIEQWHVERLGNAEQIRNNNPLLKSIKKCFADKNQQENEADVKQWMNSIASNYDYNSVFICDTLQKIRLASAQSGSVLPEITKIASSEALKDMKARMTELYRNESSGQPTIDLIIPLGLINNKQLKPIGVIVLRIDPEKTLFPLIQTWPTNSKSAETLLIRKDGDSVLYLNELRHISNTALKLRIPLTRIEVPSVQAVLGKEGFWEGLDYRGIRVLADLRPVPGTPWFMVAKVDQSEIFSELKYRNAIVILITLLLLLFFGFGISYFYNNRQKNIYRLLSETGTKLREEKDRIRTILDMVGDPIFVKDNDHRIILANRAFYDIFCMDENSVIGFTLVEAVPENERHHFLEVDRRVLDTGIPDIREEELTVRNLTRTVITGKKRFTDESGKNFLVGSIHDITERKLAEQTLQETQLILEAAMNQSQAGIAIADAPNGALRYVNEAGLSIRGGNKSEVVDNVGIDRYVGEWNILDLDGRPLRDDEVPLARAVMYGETNSREFIIRRAINDDRIVLANAAPIKDSDGKIIAGIVVFLDITERKLAETKILQSEHNLLEAERIGKTGSWDYDVATDTAKWSENMFQLFDVDQKMPAELVFKHFVNNLVHPDDRAEVLSIFNDALLGKRPYDLEYRVIKKDGNIRYIHALAETMRDEPGKATRMIGVVKDITERKHAEEEIKTKVAELERFNRLAVGRELRVVELKKKINELSARLNLPNPYALDYLKSANDILDISKKDT